MLHSPCCQPVVTKSLAPHAVMSRRAGQHRSGEAHAGEAGQAGLASPPGLLERCRAWCVERWADARWVRRSDADKRFSTLFNHAGEALVLCDAQGHVLAVNEMAAGLLADAPSALIGQPLTHWLQQPAGARPGRFVLQAGEAMLHRGQTTARPVDVRVGRMPVAERDLQRQPGLEPEEARQWLVSLRDNTDRRKTQERLSFLANYDTLTGLPNRTLFRDRLAQAMARAERCGRPLALMFLDLDRFKVVNDSLGHEMGDRLLQHVARALTQSLRDVDSVSRMVDAEPFTLSRLGGDEFTVIAEGINGAEDASMIACRLLEALQQPHRIGDEEVVVSASVGISLYPTDNVDLDGLIRHTDMAMYRSKSMGRGTFSFFSDDLNAAVTARLSLESALRRAVERDEFVLHFQPKASLHTGAITGVEALLRWHCPGKGMVPPDRFIPVLEDTGMILPVGAWVIRAACAQLHQWDQRGLPPLRMAVNLSPRQLRHTHLASLIADTLREYSLEPQRLEIELTESLLAEDSDTTRAMLESFSRIGVRLAVDDFGTGESSLSRLQRFRIDTLKIDRAFVKSIQDNESDLGISTAVIALARSLKIGNVVAEGVETQAQADILRELACDEMQGYLLSRPLPPQELQSWIEARLRQEVLARMSVGRGADAPLERILIETAPEEAPANTPSAVVVSMGGR
jgi:diguanylate cyclase (GGDEF)-like protein